MTDELQGKLGNIVDLIAKGMSTVGDFVMSELPDVVQQYVLYGRVSQTVWTIMLGICLTFIAYTFFNKGIYNKTNLSLDERAIILIACFVGTIILAGPFLDHLQQAMMVWFAPKIWLIQEVSNLVKIVKGK